jgi:hypothetical protein
MLYISGSPPYYFYFVCVLPTERSSISALEDTHDAPRNTPIRSCFTCDDAIVGVVRIVLSDHGYCFYELLGYQIVT